MEETKDINPKTILVRVIRHATSEGCLAVGTEIRYPSGTALTLIKQGYVERVFPKRRRRYKGRTSVAVVLPTEHAVVS